MSENGLPPLLGDLITTFSSPPFVMGGGDDRPLVSFSLLGDFAMGEERTGFVLGWGLVKRNC